MRWSFIIILGDFLVILSNPRNKLILGSLTININFLGLFRSISILNWIYLYGWFFANILKFSVWLQFKYSIGKLSTLCCLIWMERQRKTNPEGHISCTSQISFVADVNYVETLFAIFMKLKKVISQNRFFTSASSHLNMKVSLQKNVSPCDNMK